MNEVDRIFVAGHTGLVGSAIVRRLKSAGFRNLLLTTRTDLDLCNQEAVRKFFSVEKPDYVFLAAARVGGIHANATAPADFIRDNLLIEANVIDSAYRHGTQKLLFLGSSCIYPRLAAQPMREDSLLTGPLEPTNEAYAIAKIAGVKLCQAYRRQYGFRAITLMPTNLYGPGDNFSLSSSHVLPALMRKIHEAAVARADSVTVWGTGTPRREFLYVDDLADACVFLMRHYDDEAIVNVGIGEDLSIRELAELVARITGFGGTFDFDVSKPDGTPRKLLDVSFLRSLGWHAQVSLEEGVKRTYEWFKANCNSFRS